MVEIKYEGHEIKLSTYLQNRYNLSYSMQARYLKENKIKINGKKEPLAYKLTNGDIIKLFILGIEDTSALISDNIEIVYEDDNLLILNKPQGIETIDENNIAQDTLINRALKYLKYNENCDYKPALCHRLDLNTSGIVLIAKNEKTQSILENIIKDHSLIKEYTCITTSIPDDTNYIKSYLKKDARTSFVKSYKSQIDGSKVALLEYKKVAINKNFAMLKVILKTGRTHQIRVQLASIDCPILGDTKYGNVKINNAANIKKQILCASRIVFPKLDNKLSYLSNKEFCVDTKNIENLFKSL